MVPHVVIVDTTVLLNILNVPGRNDDREDVIADLGRFLEEGANLLLPMGAVFETGNHIARLPDGSQRREYAEVFRDEVGKALSGSAPWVPTELPGAYEVASWLADFPEHAARGISMVDRSVIDAWDRARTRHPRHRVRIWSLDGDLTGYDFQP